MYPPDELKKIDPEQDNVAVFLFNKKYPPEAEVLTRKSPDTFKIAFPVIESSLT